MPDGRYEACGDFYLDLPLDLSLQPIASVFFDVVRHNIPTDCCDAEFYGARPSTIWVKWRYAQRAEAIPRLFWPDIKVDAKANPNYQARDHTREVRQALTSGCEAIVAAEALVRCGAAIPQLASASLSARAAQLMGAGR